MEAVTALSRQGLDVTPVTDTARGLDDLEILTLASTTGRVLITFDMDFGELVFRRGLKVPGIILLRFAPQTPGEVAERISDLVRTNVPVEGHFVVVERGLVRAIKISTGKQSPP